MKKTVNNRTNSYQVQGWWIWKNTLFPIEYQNRNHILENLSTLQTVHELVNDYLFLKQYNEVAVQNINTISPIAPAIASGRTKEFWEYCSFTSFLSEVIVESMSAVDVLLVESISAVDVLLFSGDQTMYSLGICSADCTETHRHRHSESPHMAISLKNIHWNFFKYWISIFFVILILPLLSFLNSG